MAATVASVVRASTRAGAPSLPERRAGRAAPRARHGRAGRMPARPSSGSGSSRGRSSTSPRPSTSLPEAVLPVIGAADDAVVISWAVKAFFEETERFIAWEVGQGLHRPRPRRGTATWAPAWRFALGRVTGHRARCAAAVAGGVRDRRRGPEVPRTGCAGTVTPPGLRPPAASSVASRGSRVPPAASPVSVPGRGEHRGDRVTGRVVASACAFPRGCGRPRPTTSSSRCASASSAEPAPRTRRRGARPSVPIHTPCGGGTRSTGTRSGLSGRGPCDEARGMPKISLSGPAELLTVIPFHLGFQPVRSVVVVCFHGQAARARGPARPRRREPGRRGRRPDAADPAAGIAVVGGPRRLRGRAATSPCPCSRRSPRASRPTGWSSASDSSCATGGGAPSGATAAPTRAGCLPEQADVPAVASYVALGHAVLPDRDELARLVEPLAPTEPRHDLAVAAIDDWQRRYAAAGGVDHRRTPTRPGRTGSDRRARPTAPARRDRRGAGRPRRRRPDGSTVPRQRLPRRLGRGAARRDRGLRRRALAARPSSVRCVTARCATPSWAGSARASCRPTACPTTSPCCSRCCSVRTSGSPRRRASPEAAGGSRPRDGGEPGRWPGTAVGARLSDPDLDAVRSLQELSSDEGAPSAPSAVAAAGCRGRRRPDDDDEPTRTTDAATTWTTTWTTTRTSYEDDGELPSDVSRHDGAGRAGRLDDLAALEDVG